MRYSLLFAACLTGIFAQAQDHTPQQATKAPGKIQLKLYNAMTVNKETAFTGPAGSLFIRIFLRGIMSTHPLP